MNILISNDDGITSNGIHALKKALSRKHNVFLIAPAKEKSATSQALTIFHRMHVEKLDDTTYTVDGFPTDCVNIGLFGEIFPEIDMVISGINRGVNMGHDVHYSGTVGAARHGAVHNRYSLAVSSGNRIDDYDYRKEAEFIALLIDKKLSSFRKGVVYNINFPIDYPEDISKIKLTKLGKRTYSDKYEVAHIKENVYHYFLALTELGYVNSPGSDFESFYRNYVTLTPITLYTTDMEEFKHLEENFFKG
ncbi:MAG: 5'/3'-nucleotidase SurE [Leptospiraceae bacterium]|nr:5'/3'-nucleotidase SurE [Leptospiraceae bacterium]